MASPLLPKLTPGPLVTAPNTLTPTGPYIHQRLLGTSDNPYIHQALLTPRTGPMTATPNVISQGGPLINTGQDMRQALIQTLKPNLFPGNLHSGSVPSELSSTVPGIKIVRIPRNGKMLNWEGEYEKLSKPPSGFGKGSATVGYNAVDSNGNIVGTINGYLDPHRTYVDSLYVDPKYRSSGLFGDLIKPVMGRGVPVEASIANPRLAALVDRLKSRYPLLSEVDTKHPLGWDPGTVERWDSYVDRMTNQEPSGGWHWVS